MPRPEPRTNCIILKSHDRVIRNVRHAPAPRRFQAFTTVYGRVGKRHSYQRRIIRGNKQQIEVNRRSHADAMRPVNPFLLIFRAGLHSDATNPQPAEMWPVFGASDSASGSRESVGGRAPSSGLLFSPGSFFRAAPQPLPKGASLEGLKQLPYERPENKPKVDQKHVSGEDSPVALRWHTSANLPVKLLEVRICPVTY